MATDIKHAQSTYSSTSEESSYYYKHACEICIPLVVKLPLYVEPEVIAKKPVCTKKNGHYDTPVPVG